MRDTTSVLVGDTVYSAGYNRYYNYGNNVNTPTSANNLTHMQMSPAWVAPNLLLP